MTKFIAIRAIVGVRIKLTAYYERGQDFYADGQNYALASLLYTAGPTLFGKSTFGHLLAEPTVFAVELLQVFLETARSEVHGQTPGWRDCWHDIGSFVAMPIPWRHLGARSAGNANWALPGFSGESRALPVIVERYQSPLSYPLMLLNSALI